MEGQVWIQQFNLHLTNWITNQRQDPTDFEQAINALRNMMEREPDTAGYVANLISTLIKQHVLVLPDVILEVAAKRGLEALRLVSQESSLRHLTHSNLLNHLALAYIEQGKYGLALDEVQDSMAHLKDSQCKEQVLTGLFRAQARLLEGRCREGLLDFYGAQSAYDEVEAIVVEITEDEKRMSDVLIAQVHFEYPLESEQLPKDAIQAEMTLLWRQLCNLRIESVIGASRCAIICEAGNVDMRLQKIVEVSQRNGIGNTTPLELASVIRAADYKVANISVQQIIEVVDKLDLNIDDFSGVLHAALSVTAVSAIDRETEQQSATEGLAQTEDPLIQAAIQGLLLCSHEESETRESIVDNFIQSLDLLGYVRDQRLNAPANRMVFDEPVLLALHALCARGKDLLPWTPFERTLLLSLSTMISQHYHRLINGSRSNWQITHMEILTNLHVILLHG